MKTIAELYPQRRRETNVELIKGVRDATSQEALRSTRSSDRRESTGVPG